MEKVIRSFNFQMRAFEDKEKMEVEGYALKFDKETQIGSGYWAYIEKIDKKAMDTADLKDVVLNFNHDDSNLLARTTNGSLELIVDDVGLLIRATLPETTLGKDTYELIRSGLINQMSFAAMVKKSEWEISEDDSELDKRTFVEFGRFFDVSVVTFPAYQDTSISTRGRGEIDEEVKRHFAKKAYVKQIAELNKIFKN